jgi:hypothetical protein
MRVFSGKNPFSSLPRAAIVVLGLLLVAGFLAAVGAARFGRDAQTTTASTTHTTTTSTTTTSTTHETTTATTTASTTTSTTPETGCPPAAPGATVSVDDVHPPARLQVASFVTMPRVIPGSFSFFHAEAKITDTCGQPVQGAFVYVTAVPYNQITIHEGTSGSDGTVPLTFTRLRGFPAATHQGLMVFFVRAVRSGDNLLAGISTRRLVSVRVHL